VLGKMMPSEARRVDAGIYEISVPRSGLMDIRIIKTNEEVLS
jgi:hypothetical protein